MKRLVFSALVVLGLLAVVSWWFWRSATPVDTEGEADLAWFSDVTDESGLDFVHDAGPIGDYFMPQSFGSGAAVFDFDGDGRLDLYLLTNGGPTSKSINRLYRNMPDGTFKDVTAGSGLGIAGYNMGVAIGDVNNDGLPDVLVTQYGGVKLFFNQGGGKFVDGTISAGLDNPGWGTSAAFFDFDRDGWLDLVVVNYIDYDPTWPCKSPRGVRDFCGPQPFPGSITRLFRNAGPAQAGAAIRFKDVSLESGVGRTAGPGLGVVCADFDGDGWPDIFIANDGQPNHLWINQKDGTFKEEAALRGLAVNALGHAQAGMGVALGDVDGDGLSDVFVTHLHYETHALWKQGPRGLYQDRTGAVGLARPRWHGTGFGTVLADFDLDGHLDLAIANGYVSRENTTSAAGLGSFWDAYADRNQLFANDGNGRFTDVSPRNKGFCARFNVARGLAWGDLNGIGRVDLLVAPIADRARLYRNVARTDGHWLVVQARLPSPGDSANARKDRDALGAEVTIEAGTRRWVRLISASGSYLCSSDPRAHFGLGSVDQVDRITVHWPDGRRESFAGCAANRLVEVRQGHGQSLP